MDMGGCGGILYYIFLKYNGKLLSFLPRFILCSNIPQAYKGKSVRRGRDTNSGKCSKSSVNIKVVKAV